MSVETKRIYKIDKDDFYGITQGARPIMDNEGNVTGHVQTPVATIGYGDRLLVVEPYQVEFKHTPIEYHRNTGYGDNSTAGDIIRYAKSVGSENMMCEYNDKGFKELIITWEE